MTLHTLRSGVTAAVALAVAVGCAGIPFLDTSTKQPGAAHATALGASENSGAIHPIAAFLASARPGDSAYLNLPDSGKRVHVTAQRVYFAASGRSCRRYDVASTNSPVTTTAGLACKNNHDDWKLENLIVNPDDINAPPRSERQGVYEFELQGFPTRAD